jgi:hypothetical protein
MHSAGRLHSVRFPHPWLLRSVLAFIYWVSTCFNFGKRTAKDKVFFFGLNKISFLAFKIVIILISYKGNKSDVRLLSFHLVSMRICMYVYINLLSLYFISVRGRSILDQLSPLSRAANVL